MVKTVLLIMFAFIFLLESLFPRGLALTEYSKLFKLIEHYQEHVFEEPLNQIGFGEFVWMHYNPTSDHENEAHHHEQLPDLNTGNTVVGLIYGSFESALNPLLSNFVLLNMLLPEYKNGYQFVFSLDLIHPPQ
ncbi:MAG: hypothetical protein ACI9DJ_003331 [Algoriphagus sp.]|jgi:hypothetical protein